MSMAYRKFLTDKEYCQLPYPGQVLADYWAEFLPKMTAEMKADGTLLPTLQKRGTELAEWNLQMIEEQKMPVDAAWEFVKEEIYSLKPENTD